MNYADYLKSLGASDEEIKILDTPTARKGYEKQQADAVAARDAAVTAAQAAMDAKNQEWWDNDVNPALTAKDTEILKLSGETARVRAALKKANELGLTQVAIDEGHTPANPPAAANGSPTFDASKYVDRETFTSAFERTGEAIAMAQSIAAEHVGLFGSALTDWEELRKLAVASRKSIRQVWEDKYKVSDKRTEAAKAAQDAHDKKIRDEAVTATETRLRQEYGSNPNLRHAATSRNSFTTRPMDKEKPLWDANGVTRKDELASARVQKYAAKVQ